MYIGVARWVQWVAGAVSACALPKLLGIYRTNVPYVLNFGALTSLRLHKDISQFDVIIPSCPD